MTRRTDRLIRFLIGDLPEFERDALEREFFEDPALFERLLEAETTLVDDYARGRLPPPLRRQFEANYLARPPLRERAEFAQLLARAVDREDHDIPPDSLPHRSVSDWLTPFAAAAAVVFLIVSGWLWTQNRRLRNELARAESARALADAGGRDQHAQLPRSTDEGQPRDGRADRPGPPATAPVAPPTVADGPSTFSLVLVPPTVRAPGAGGVRTVVIPTATRGVRVEVALPERAYPAYRLALQAVGGGDAYVSEAVRPSGSGATTRVSAVVPADRFAAGDYVLTVSGDQAGSAPDDVARFLLRVERR